MDRNTNLIGRLLLRSKPLSVTLGVSLLFLLLPFVAVALDGLIEEVLRLGQWRVLMLPSVIILYFWWISPAISRRGDQTLQTARLLVEMDEESFLQFIRHASRVNPYHEYIAFIIGVMLGLLSTLSTEFSQNAIWVRIYWIVGTCLMYGLLAWTIFSSVISTRLFSAIHDLPLSFDIFDTSGFEDFGRYSLILSMAFIGGMTLSLVFTFQVASIYQLEFWLIYIILALVTILIFFLGMRPSHQVLSREKSRELKIAQRHILRASRELMQQIELGKNPGTTAAEINALSIYEERLQGVQTWPYNIAMLRTLFLTVLIPLGSMLGREILEILLGG